MCIPKDYIGIERNFKKLHRKLEKVYSHKITRVVIPSKKYRFQKCHFLKIFTKKTNKLYFVNKLLFLMKKMSIATQLHVPNSLQPPKKLNVRASMSI